MFFTFVIQTTKAGRHLNSVSRSEVIVFFFSVYFSPFGTAAAIPDAAKHRATGSLLSPAGSPEESPLGVTVPALAFENLLEKCLHMVQATAGFKGAVFPVLPFQTLDRADGG